MKKMTVCELQCKLYFENLREKNMNRNFMFTTIGEKELDRATQAVEMKIKEIEEKESLSDEDLTNSLGDMFENVEDIRKYLELSKERFRGDFLTRRLLDCKNLDFTLAFLFACWKNRFGLDYASEAAIIDSYIQHDFVIDTDNICIQVLKDIYLEYVSLNRSIHLKHEEVFHIISSFGTGDGVNALEIDTDFFGKSTKVISKTEDYYVSKAMRDLTESESKVYRYKNFSQVPNNNSFNTIVARLSSCQIRSLDGVLDFFNDLVCHAEKSGRIILIDTEQLLASDEMYAFRKKMIEDSLLEIYVSGQSLFSFADVYILRAYGSSENVMFSFVSDHLHSASVNDNLLTLHNKLSKKDVRSIDYNFNATSDLLTGQQGMAYSFCNLFSAPKTGVAEKKVSGLHHVFQMKDMPHNFDDGIKNSADLELCDITGSYKVLTENKLIFFIGNNKIQCCYVEASEDKPVVVGHQFVVLDLNVEILTPEYVQILCAKGVMEKVFDGEYMKRKDFQYSDFSYDSFIGKEILYTPEDKIAWISTMIQVPSCEQQKREILDARFINASAIERERALEMLLAEKTWLNEEHIRNIKHRISNELLPIKNDIDAIVKLLARHPEGITFDTTRGKDERVFEIIERLTRCISRVNESLQDLTRTIDKGNLKPVDIVAIVKDFVRDVSSNQSYKMNLKVPNESIKVNGSKNMLFSMMRNIVNNALRHGFIDKSRIDYAIEITIEKDGNGNCVLDVKNNGAPMNELARDSYFKRGSVAGSTGHSGIGGADVKDCANAMGGDVTLPLIEGGWTVCVRISLPILNSEKI